MDTFQKSFTKGLIKMRMGSHFRGFQVENERNIRVTHF